MGLAASGSLRFDALLELLAADKATRRTALEEANELRAMQRRASRGAGRRAAVGKKQKRPPIAKVTTPSAPVRRVLV